MTIVRDFIKDHYIEDTADDLDMLLSCLYDMRPGFEGEHTIELMLMSEDSSQVDLHSWVRHKIVEEVVNNLELFGLVISSETPLHYLVGLTMPIVKLDKDDNAELFKRYSDSDASKERKYVMISELVYEYDNDPTYYVGFSPIYDEATDKVYKVSGGSATGGWAFRELGSSASKPWVSGNPYNEGD